ncbi:BCL2 modifying factor 2 [Stigmatopora argus]
MDDEEEDTSRPVSLFWGTPFREPKHRAESPRTAGVTANDNNNSISVLACNLQMQQRVPFHGNAALRWHFPAHFEPTEDRGQPTVADEEESRQDDGMAERPATREEAAEADAAPGPSAEAQIGQKLREIGDQFQRDHIDLILRQQRQNLPLWMRLTAALLGFLFPRAPPGPRPRGAHR